MIFKKLVSTDTAVKNLLTRLVVNTGFHAEGEAKTPIPIGSNVGSMPGEADTIQLLARSYHVSFN